eukprot:CAMPEP_0170178276 /NCGR_PEP_ID=MMETSP0040_2-20121228/11775_1 /TAXON_ID=641309 /ORGANISM="Lotharella oceanica, Strain CCMP622" /LENGTH=32 /DNA_ID= /DNA_START= /DNA_END= /DNA_ORIENTATION=
MHFFQKSLAKVVVRPIALRVDEADDLLQEFVI